MNNLPPQNLEAEESILARCMLSPSEIDDICDLISPGDFYKSAHQKIFAAIISLVSKKIHPDLPALNNYLRDNNQLEEIGGATHLARLMYDVPMAHNNEHFCKIIKGKSVLRQLIVKANEIGRSCHDNNGNVETVLDFAQREILSIDMDSGVHDFMHIKDMIDERIDFYEERYHSKSELTGISSGYPKLDYFTAGFQDTDLIILAGRPSHGKTAFSLNLIRNMAKNGIKSGKFSLEMSDTQLFDRLIAMESEINSTKFRTGRFQPDQWPIITDAMSEISRWSVLFETLTFEMTKITRKARKMVKEGAQIIFVDYLSLVEGDKSRKRHEEVAETARAFKRLAKELNIPIVLLVQLNRGFKDRKNKKPVLYDLRESGEIEQAADVVMFIYRQELDEKDEENHPKHGMAELIIEKQRNGPLGIVDFYFNKFLTEFLPMIKEDRHHV